jgi:hypothetical protein
MRSRFRLFSGVAAPSFRAFWVPGMHKRPETITPGPVADEAGGGSETSGSFLPPGRYHVARGRRRGDPRDPGQTGNAPAAGDPRLFFRVHGGKPVASLCDYRARARAWSRRFHLGQDHAHRLPEGARGRGGIDRTHRERGHPGRGRAAGGPSPGRPFPAISESSTPIARARATSCACTGPTGPPGS